MRNRFLFFLFFNLCIGTLYSQDSHREYFQQETDYKISVSLNDSLHTLSGNISINYENNSPDTLNFIYIHLWANAYSSLETKFAKQRAQTEKDFQFSSKDERGYIVTSEFFVDSLLAQTSYHNNDKEICKLTLPSPLLPNSSINIQTSFLLKIPKLFSRLGHSDNAYYISQWYPKPAVYDRHGWHTMNYIDYGEFYSEFGSFDVEITLPENYFVAATGVLQTEEEKLRIEKRVIETLDDNFEHKMESSDNYKTIRFYQDSIHDFAWFADPRFLIRKDYVKLPTTEDYVETWIYYRPENTPFWKNANEYLNSAIWFFSSEIGHYPYSQCTAVDGSFDIGGGMEYPMITLIGNSDSKSSLERVIVHELGHNWFYGILGFNEREEPWLDEGLTSFYENKYFQWKYSSLKFNHQNLNLKLSDISKIFSPYSQEYTHHLATQYFTSRNMEQAMSLHSEEMHLINYFYLNYVKPLAVFTMLEENIGKSNFQLIMHDFYNDWAFKHPQTSDFKRHLEDEANKDLSWFFDDILEKNKKIDYKISKVKSQKDNTYKVKIKNKTGVEAPLTLDYISEDGKIIKTENLDGFKGKKGFEISPEENTHSLFVNSSFENLELDRYDNHARLKGVFKRFRSPSVNLFYSLPNINKNQIYVLPILGMNKYDALMPGIAFYNDPAIIRKVDFVFSPLYSFKTNEWNGFFDIGYNIRPQGNFWGNVRVGLNGRKYSYKFLDENREWFKLAQEVELNYKPNSKMIENQTLIRNIYLSQGVHIWNSNPTIVIDDTYIKRRNYILLNIHHKLKRHHKINPYQLDFDLLLNDKFYKTSLTYTSRHYFKRKFDFEYRIFAGYMTPHYDTYYSPGFKFQTSGISAKSSGDSDYLFDEVFFGRSETSGFWSRQMVQSEGGFKTYTPLGNSLWMSSINASVSIPRLEILRLFAGILSFDKANEQLQNNEIFLYEAGIELRLWKDALSVSVPLLISPDMKRIENLYGHKWHNRIRFVLNLKAINPFIINKKPHYIAL
ncbi:MAG: hypothetical protein GX140_06315 [Bacteroidales bacterium]|jgi:hypothetical protein|nr:hypothetical protein [Bacteroidales bacterium]